MPQLVVIAHGILQMTHDGRSDASALQVFADRFGQQTGQLLVSVTGKLFEVEPGWFPLGRL
jgi:hypothetical protein